MREFELRNQLSFSRWPAVGGGGILLCLSACGATPLRGAEISQPSTALEPKALAAYESTACVDADGAELKTGRMQLSVIGSQRGLRLRIAREDGARFEIYNSWWQQPERVFQAVLASTQGRAVLLDARLPTLPDGHLAAQAWGRMAIADHWAELGASEAFRASLPRVAIACWLRPLQSL